MDAQLQLTVAATSLIVLAAASITASYFDYRTRRIPNALNWFCLAFSLAAALLASAPPLYYALVLCAFVFALFLYFVGAWAGGDAKFFTVAIALAGLARFPNAFSDLLFVAWVFLLAAALAVPAALAARRERAWRQRRVFFGAVGASVKDALGSAFVAGVVFCLGFFVFAWRFDTLAPLLAWTGALVFIASLALRAAFFAAGLLKNKIPLDEVVAGVVPAQTIFLDSSGELREWGLRNALRSVLRGESTTPKGRLLCDSRRARGLTPSEARELKRVFKARGVKFLLVREALPFAPQVGAAAFTLAALRVFGFF
ncbi:MAG: A24 family peptidase [Candidatus Norongarragalinales archaeon]